jgi:hypothetical protein
MVSELERGLRAPESPHSDPAGESETHRTAGGRAARNVQLESSLRDDSSRRRCDPFNSGSSAHKRSKNWNRRVKWLGRFSSRSDALSLARYFSAGGAEWMSFLVAVSDD